MQDTYHNKFQKIPKIPRYTKKSRKIPKITKNCQKLQKIREITMLFTPRIEIISKNLKCKQKLQPNFVNDLKFFLKTKYKVSHYFHG